MPRANTLCLLYYIISFIWLAGWFNRYKNIEKTSYWQCQSVGSEKIKTCKDFFWAETRNRNSKLEIKTRNQNSKSKLKIETQNWNSESKLEIETRNRNSKLKLEIEIEAWNSKILNLLKTASFYLPSKNTIVHPVKHSWDLCLPDSIFWSLRRDELHSIEPPEYWT